MASSLPARNAPSASGLAGQHAQSLHCLVTGGAGFIGSHLVDVLVASGARVTVVDDCSTGRESNLAHHALTDASLTGLSQTGLSQTVFSQPASLAAGSPSAAPRVRFVRSDLAAALAGQLAHEQFDEVYHLAAAVGVALVVKDPIRCIQTNVHQTQALLDFVSVRRTPTLLASSSEVYGKGSKNPFSETDDVVYGSTDKPRWSYAASKAIDEYLGLAFHAQRGVPVAIARFFNTVGPRQRGDYGMVVPRFVRSALLGQALEVYGDGEQSRCFCDARDVARALPLMVRSEKCLGRVCNVGSDQSVTMNGLAHEVLRVVSRCDWAKPGATLKHLPYEAVYGSAFEDLRQRRPDLTRIREAIGFAPRLSLEQTILDIATELRPSVL